jgi:hypothetical protein
MKKIIVVLVFAVCLFGCEKKANVAIPEEFIGKWYEYISPTESGELVCEIFSDKITFYSLGNKIDIYYTKAFADYFEGKSFRPSSLEDKEGKETLTFKLPDFVNAVHADLSSADKKRTESFLEAYIYFKKNLYIGVYSSGTIGWEGMGILMRETK